MREVSEGGEALNYIRLINAFYDRLETSQLSTSAIALWHALANVNNKAGWLREFAVAASVLCIKTGLSERTISNARNDLKMKGFIDFKSRKGSKSAIYQLYDLSAMVAYKVSGKSLPAIDADNASDKPSDNASALVSCETKQDKTKQQHAVSRRIGSMNITSASEHNPMESNAGILPFIWIRTGLKTR